jgi:nitrilase
MFDLPDPSKLKWPFHETNVANQLCSQFAAIEGQTFVLVATQVLTEGNLEKLNLVDSGVCQTVGFLPVAQLPSVLTDVSASPVAASA